MEGDAAFAPGDRFELGGGGLRLSGVLGGGDVQGKARLGLAGEFVVGGDGEEALATLDVGDVDAVAGAESGFAGGDVAGRGGGQAASFGIEHMRGDESDGRTVGHGLVVFPAVALPGVVSCGDAGVQFDRGPKGLAGGHGVIAALDGFGGDDAGVGDVDVERHPAIGHRLGGELANEADGNIGDQAFALGVLAAEDRLVHDGADHDLFAVLGDHAWIGGECGAGLLLQGCLDGADVCLAQELDLSTGIDSGSVGGELFEAAVEVPGGVLFETDEGDLDGDEFRFLLRWCFDGGLLRACDAEKSHAQHACGGQQSAERSCAGG